MLPSLFYFFLFNIKIIHKYYLFFPLKKLNSKLPLFTMQMALLPKMVVLIIEAHNNIKRFTHGAIVVSYYSWFQLLYLTMMIIVVGSNNILQLYQSFILVAFSH